MEHPAPADLMAVLVQKETVPCHCDPRCTGQPTSAPVLKSPCAMGKCQKGLVGRMVTVIKQQSERT